MMEHAARAGIQYSNNYEYNDNRQQRVYEEPVKIFVVNGDCLDTVRRLKMKYPDSNPVLLNMANAHTPGGGWRSGSYFSLFFLIMEFDFFAFVKVVELKKKIFIVVQIYFNVSKIPIINLPKNEIGLIQFLK
jgi:hypothetical protein